MNTITLTQAVFSPTGGTQRVADAIVPAMQVNKIDLCTEVEPLPLLTPLMAVLPVYGGRLPAVAVERLRKISGQGQPAVAVVVYGNRAYEDALLELKDVLTDCGFVVVAAAAFIAEHSIVRSIAAGRPNAEDVAAAADFGKAVAAKIAAGDKSPVTVPGNYPYKDLPQMPVVPLTLESCRGCGRCARLCPVGAIPAHAPHTTDASKCILCMRCVAVCFRRSRLLPAQVLDVFTQRLNAVAAEPKQPEVFV
ncbi:MAG: 4Fe-4S dicluster domain-containing protein [Akkermansiaceae bacterium]|nr:4Fe-4S dicluster domain-containing protein [Akkermansiaceae bacterium]